MADPTGSAPRSSRRITAIDWAIIALGLGLALLLLVGGLLPARERDRKIREENDRIADDVLDLKDELRKRRERIEDRRNDPHATEREIRERGGLGEGEIPLPPDEPAAPPKKQPAGNKRR